MSFGRRSARFAPRLEALEDRVLPSASLPIHGVAPAPAATDLLRLHTGVRGIALLGPLSPVERPGVTNAKPLVGALIQVRRVGTETILAKVRTDDHGRFIIPLHAGKYEILSRAPNPAQFFPFSRPQLVNVGTHGYTSVIVHFDTGIR